MSKYSIGVVTYIKRFDEYFVPLVRQLDQIFPDVEKNYILNGFYDQVQQVEYLHKAKKFLSTTGANNIVYYNEHQALTKCWNQLIINSSSEKVLILNDDLVLNRLFRWCLDLQIQLYDTAVINGSWSHFVISKNIIKKVGWFDERFVGIGHEDADYGLRLGLAFGKTEMKKNWLHNIFALGLKNLVVANNDPGWKLISPTALGKYAQANSEFFDSKWEGYKTHEKGSVYAFNDRYFKIRPGMETPEFYKFDVLKLPKV